MVDKQFFIDDILNSAKIKAEDILFEAETKKAEAFAKLELEMQLAAKDNVEKENLASSEIIKSGKVESNAVANSEVLKAKQAQLDNVFNKAKQEILGLADKNYKDFISKLIKKHASSGDTVVVATGDKKRLDKVFFDSIATNLKIKLNLSKENLNASGGIMLQNDNCDIDLTIEALVAQSRHALESSVAKALWQ